MLVTSGNFLGLVSMAFGSVHYVYRGWPEGQCLKVIVEHCQVMIFTALRMRWKMNSLELPNLYKLETWSSVKQNEVTKKI